MESLGGAAQEGLPRHFFVQVRVGQRGRAGHELTKARVVLPELDGHPLPGGILATPEKTGRSDATETRGSLERELGLRIVKTTHAMIFGDYAVSLKYNRACG